MHVHIFWLKCYYAWTFAHRTIDATCVCHLKYTNACIDLDSTVKMDLSRFRTLHQNSDRSSRQFKEKEEEEGEEEEKEEKKKKKKKKKKKEKEAQQGSGKAAARGLMTIQEYGHRPRSFAQSPSAVTGAPLLPFWIPCWRP